MAFQNGQFVRNQNFVRDRDLGPPNDTIDAAKVDDEFANVAGGLTTLKVALDALDPYTKAAADERFGTKAAVDSKLDKAGGATTGPITLGGKAGAAKGVVSNGTATFDYADGNVQTITINGNVTIDFANLPAAGGTLQVNIVYQSGAIAVAGTTWWELGGGEKTTSLAELGVVLRAGRPYRLIVEIVSGLRTGILQ